MLVFPLKKEWYEKIKSGEKTIEYREVKPYWTKRFNSKSGLDDIFISLLKSKSGENCNIPCKLRLGYTNKYLVADITRIEIIDGKDTDLHIDKPVYAIHLTHVREVKYVA